MQSIDLEAKLPPHRRRLQRIMQWSCYSAVAITAVLMLLFFTTLGYRGIGAFTQTKIDVTVTTIESSTKRTINTAMYNLVENPDRATKKGLRQLVTPNAYSTLDIEEPGTYTLVAHTDVDMYVKGVYDKLTDNQRTVTDMLIADGKIYKTWNWDFWTNSDSRSPEIAGIWGAAVGTFYTIGLAILFAFPIGVGCATYMEEFPKRQSKGWRRYNDFMEININNLAAVPSIVYGLLGLALLINFFGMPRSASLVGAMTLGILILPVIVISARTSLRTVPQSIRDASNGLGASRLQTTIYQVLPAAMPGIITGTIIGIARAIGESAPLLMIGMVAFILVPPTGVMDPATTLPVQIFLWADSPERGFAEKTSAAIFVLLMVLSSVLLPHPLGPISAVTLFFLICKLQSMIAWLSPYQIFRFLMFTLALLSSVSVSLSSTMVFQKPNPFPKSIYDNIAYGPQLHRMHESKEHLDSIVEESLKRANLWKEVRDRLHDNAFGLSGGQQQRLCIARTIAVDPQIILLDEPCSALDPISTNAIEELVLDLKKNYTIVVVTHNMQQAKRISDTTAYFHLGEIVEVGSTKKIFDNPNHRKTRSYVSGEFG